MKAANMQKVYAIVYRILYLKKYTRDNVGIKNFCEVNSPEYELFLSMKSTKSSKPPENDGLTREFLREFSG